MFYRKRSRQSTHFDSVVHVLIVYCAQDTTLTETEFALVSTSVKSKSFWDYSGNELFAQVVQTAAYNCDYHLLHLLVETFSKTIVSQNIVKNEHWAYLLDHQQMRSLALKLIGCMSNIKDCNTGALFMQLIFQYIAQHRRRIVHDKDMQRFIIDFMKALVSRGFDLNQTFSDETLIVFVIKYDLKDLVEPIIKMGADPHLITQNKQNATDAAIMSDMLPIAHKLIELNCLPYSIGSLHWLVATHNHDMLNKIFSYRDLDTTDPLFVNNKTIMMRSIECVCTSKPDSLHVFWLLMHRQKGTINVKNTHGNTALHIAAQKGKVHVMRDLVAFGADLYTINNDGKSPLCYVFDQMLNITPNYSDILSLLNIAVKNRVQSQIHEELVKRYHKFGFEFDVVWSVHLPTFESASRFDIESIFRVDAPQSMALIEHDEKKMCYKGDHTEPKL